MTQSVLFAIGKKALKTVVTTGLEGITYAGDAIAKTADENKSKIDSKVIDNVLDGISYAGDKISELSGDAQTEIESWGKVDLKTDRELRKESRAKTGSILDIFSSDNKESSQVDETTEKANEKQ